MIKSMTGCGRSEFTLGEETFFVEAKSLNHRYLDTKVRVPDRFFGLDNRIREEVKKRFSRGSFSLVLYCESPEVQALRVNIPAARVYLDAAEELKKELGVGGEVNLDLLMRQREVFTTEKKLVDIEAEWGAIEKGLSAAFDQLEEWRIREGKDLEEDLIGRLKAIEAHLSRVEARSPEVLEAYRKRITEEITKMVEGEVDEARIMLEAAVFAERTAISEETVRLKSHLAVFRDYLASDEPVGKRLDFLCQEVFREINTIASKASDAGISQTVVEMKSETEKIREQVKNIE